GQGAAGVGGAAAGGRGGAAGKTGGGGAGTGTVCPGVQPLSGTNLCRSASDCPGNGYLCTSDPSGVSSACASYCISPPPRNDCTVDGDCGTGKVCLSSVT